MLCIGRDLVKREPWSDPLTPRGARHSLEARGVDNHRSYTGIAQQMTRQLVLRPIVGLSLVLIERRIRGVPGETA
jgi:hypothetical protein